MTILSLTDNIIDSRDIIERLKELRDEREALVETVTQAQEALDEAPQDFPDRTDLAALVVEKQNDLDAWDDDNGEELKTLETVNSEGESATSEWPHGVALIADSYFETYAQELAEDLGTIDRNAAWPACHIDWEAAAASLQIDYSTIEINGRTYWYRS